MTSPSKDRLAARFRAALLALILGVCMLSSGCGASLDKAGSIRTEDPVVLSMLTPFGGPQVQPFIDAVDRLSGGALRIDAQEWESGQLSAEPDAVHAVQAGQAELGLIPVRAWHGLGVRSFDALIAPLAVDSLELEGRVLSSDLVDAMLAGPVELGLTGIGILPGPIRRPVGVTTRLLGPEDYQGQTMGVSDSAVAVRTLTALKAKAQPLKFFGQPIDGVDGVELNVGAVSGNEYDGVARTITANVALWPRPQVVVGNPEALASLDDAQRQVLLDAAKAALSPSLGLDRETEDLANMCRRARTRFISATRAQLEDLRAATQPVLTWLRKDAGTAQALDRIEAMRAEVTAAGEVEAPPSCEGITALDSASPAPSGALAVTLDGVYTMTTTIEDVVAVGAPRDASGMENSGAWVFVVDGDRFAYTQENGPACTWGYGSWRVDGQSVHWVFTDGGGISPSGAKNKPGEAFAFGWSLYQDTLTLTPLPGAISPENFWAKPWHRISRTPSRHLLSPRCIPPADSLPTH